MSLKRQYFLTSEGFDAYFDKMTSEMTDVQKEELPLDLKRRVLSPSLRKPLSFEEKLAVCWKVFRKDIYIVVKDEEEGMLASDFEVWQRELAHRTYNESKVRDFSSKGMFVLGTAQICDGFHQQMLVGHSRMYQHVNRIKGAKKNELFAAKDSIVMLAKLLIFYEGSKKRMIKDTGLTVSEWYALLFFADGFEKKGSSIYLGLFFNAFQTGRSFMLRALKRLSQEGYLIRYGSRKDATYKITTRGYDMLYQVFAKYVLGS